MTDAQKHTDQKRIEQLYDMVTHEMLDIGMFMVLRVAQGWIYFDKSSNIGTFVPTHL